MKLKSSMPKTAKTASPLPRSECLCAICREILLEPVTLPCNHTLCHPCFQMTVEKANLCCPFCRLRVSTWARRNARAGTLVNQELWETIQHQFPEECRRRASGLDAEEDDFEDGFTPYPVLHLCKPGEIRQEYEQEVSKIEAERLRREEEERKASEEYIKQLLAEEEAQQLQSLEHTQREMEEQLKRDEELARILSSDLNEAVASSVQISPVVSPVVVKKSASSKSSKSGKVKQQKSGDIERFLSPKNVNVGHMRNGDILDASVEYVGSMHEESDSDDAMPVLTPQSPFIVNSSSVEEPISCNSLPRLSKHPPGNTPNAQQTVTAESQDSLDTVEFSPPRCSYSSENCGGWMRGVTSTPEQRLGFPPKQTLNLTRDDMDCDGESSLLFAPSSHTERLKELEETLHEKKMQEEQDRLLALKLQKLLDKESQVSRQKGSPDEYKLRPKRNATAEESTEDATPKRLAVKRSAPQRNATAEESTEDATPKRPAVKRSAPQRNVKSSESEESSDENQKPVKRRVAPRQEGERRARKESQQPSLANGIKILKPSNKQQTILDMFQRPARK